MSFITKQANGQWRARWRTPDGRERSKTFRLKADAERHLTGTEHSKATGAYVDPGRGRITFAHWVPMWRAGVVDLRPSTLARDDGYIDRYLLPTFKAMRLADIDRPAVTAWVAQMNGPGPVAWWDTTAEPDRERRPLSAATTVKAGQILGKIMAAAVAAGRLQSSPCVGMKLPRIEREEMRFLSPTEVADLAGAMDDSYRALVYLGAYGGLRIGEMLGLRTRRLDVIRGRVDVAEILVEVSGHLHSGPPKTKAGRRSVPLPRVATATLAKHLQIYGGGPDDYVFRTESGPPTRLANWRHRVWAPAVAKAGLGQVRPHDLRHTAVALWIAAGASPNEVAARAGHSSVVTVLDRYGHLLPGGEERVNDALDALANTAADATPRATVTHIGPGGR